MPVSSEGYQSSQLLKRRFWPDSGLTNRELPHSWSHEPFSGLIKELGDDYLCGCSSLWIPVPLASEWLAILARSSTQPMGEDTWIRLFQIKARHPSCNAGKAATPILIQ
jgi:hypothetical protein